MRLKDTIKISLRGIVTQRSRSILTMLGIVIGISSVILMLSLGQGAQSLILSQVASFGAQTVFVEPGSGDQQGPPIGVDLGLLKQRDIDAVKKNPSFDRVSGVVFRQVRVVAGEVDKKLQVVGALPDELAINDVEVERGRFFDDTEVRARARVAVIGQTVRDTYFENREPLGEELRIHGQRFRVIGVMEPLGTQFFQNRDEQIYAPLPAFQDLLGIDYVNYVSARAVIPVEIAMEEMRTVLRDVHGIRNPENDLSKDPFRVSSTSEATAIVGTVTLALTVLLSSIAAISLVVGGIGIMNIMLVSVTERTREIGLRKAVGAREKDILLQFLMEALFLTLTGGVIGILLGSATSFLAYLVARNFISDWVFTVPPEAIALAFTVSTVVGLAFGIYPARRAAKLDPIEALRYE